MKTKLIALIVIILAIITVFTIVYNRTHQEIAPENSNTIQMRDNSINASGMVSPIK